MAKIKDQWEKYKTTIPGLDRLISDPQPVDDDDASDYRKFVGNLPSDVSDKLPEERQEACDLDLGNIQHHWCLCDMPEGDFPRVYAFPSLPRLVEAIAKRDGQETAIWAMYGIPLRITQASFTKGSNTKMRYLLLPNQLAVAISEDNDCHLIDQSLLPDNIEVQEEGWLGDPEYLKEQSYYIEGMVEEDEFSADPDMLEYEDDDEDPELN